MTELEGVLLELAPATQAILDQVAADSQPIPAIGYDLVQAKLVIEKARVALIRRRLTAAYKKHSAALTSEIGTDLVDAMFPRDEEIEAYLDAKR